MRFHLGLVNGYALGRSNSHNDHEPIFDTPDLFQYITLN